MPVSREGSEAGRVESAADGAMIHARVYNIMPLPQPPPTLHPSVGGTWAAQETSSSSSSCHRH